MLHGQQVEVREFRDAAQLAGPLGEGHAAQVVCGAAEAPSDTGRIAAWTADKAWSTASEQGWLQIKRKLLSFFDGRGDRALMRPVQRKSLCCHAGGPGGSVDRKVLSAFEF
jgi:hypothetical protein